MPYKSLATKTFLKESKKLRSGIQRMVAKSIDELASKPESGTKLKGELEGLWRLRIGDYRVIYRIDFSNNAIILLDVGLRKNIYD